MVIVEANLQRDRVARAVEIRDVERVEPLARAAVLVAARVKLGLAVDLLAGRRNDETGVVVVRAVDEVRNPLAAERPVSDMRR